MKKIFLSVLFVLMAFSIAQAENDYYSESINSGGVESVTDIVTQDNIKLNEIDTVAIGANNIVSHVVDHDDDNNIGHAEGSNYDYDLVTTNTGEMVEATTTLDISNGSNDVEDNTVNTLAIGASTVFEIDAQAGPRHGDVSYYSVTTNSGTVSAATELTGNNALMKSNIVNTTAIGSNVSITNLVR